MKKMGGYQTKFISKFINWRCFYLVYKLFIKFNSELEWYANYISSFSMTDLEFVLADLVKLNQYRGETV
jgi:hypothetical protein